VKYDITLTAFAGITVEIDAESPQEALDKAYEEVDLDSCEMDDWTQYNEVAEVETGKIVLIDGVTPHTPHTPVN